jgi:hypothetical protein
MPAGLVPSFPPTPFYAPAGLMALCSNRVRDYTTQSVAGGLRLSSCLMYQPGQ